jgi:hypothetical protein
MKTRENFCKFCFWFKSIWGLFAKFTKEKQKRKREMTKKKSKGPRGNDSAWNRNRPTAQLLDFPNRYRPPPSHIADVRAPAVSTDAFVYLQTKITRGITARNQMSPLLILPNSPAISTLAAPIRSPLPSLLSPSGSYLAWPPPCSESRSTSRRDRRAPTTIPVKASFPIPSPCTILLLSVLRI